MRFFAPNRVTGPLAVATITLALLTPLTITAPAHAAAFPTWDQVQAARGDEQAKQRQITSLNALIARLQTATKAAAARAEKAGQAYQVAQDDLDQAAGTYAKLASETAAAQHEADTLENTVGQVDAALARPGGASLSAGVIFGQGDPTSLLQGLSMSSKIGEQVNNLYARASTTAKTASALANQARVAKTARTRLAGAAQAALDDAVAANEAAVAAEQSEQDNLGVMNAQLATLKDDRLSLEDGYQKGVAARATAAAARAAAETRARQAAAAAAAARTAQSVSSSAGAGEPPATGGASIVNGWTRPITSYSFYQAYGYRIHPVYHDYRLHAGADFSATCGAPIYATAAGTVTYAGPYGGYGNLIIVDHGNGITSAYAHVYSTGIYVRTGQAVGAGQNIAGVGNAGVSTGCHLHFEIRVGGVATDPMAFLALRNVR